jgi:hypothetical protein
MTNFDNGWSLQQELVHTIAQVYAWPELPLKLDVSGINKSYSMNIPD